MIRPIVLFICLVFPISAYPFGVSNVGTIGPTVAPSGACGTFTTGNLLSETFNTNPGYDNTWTPNVDAPATVNPDESTTPGSSICGFGGEWLNITVPTGTFDDNSTSTAITTAPIVYVRFIWNLESEGIADGNDVAIFGTNGFSIGGKLTLNDDLGVLTLNFLTGGSVRDTSGALELQTAYCIELLVDNTNDLWEWRIDEVSQGSGAGDPSNDASNIRLGGGAAATNVLINYQIDNLDISSTDWLGCDQ